MKLKVNSEIGPLKTVLLHRPGKELENLTPELLERLLFDDIPYLKVAQEEHDAFANTLRDHGVEVLYITDMVIEALDAHPEIRGQFINQFIEESNVLSNVVKHGLYEYLMKLDNETLVHTMIEGIRQHDIEVESSFSIVDMLENEYPFYTDPLPNLLFQRDPFATIDNGVAINNMMTEARSRETLLAEYMIRYNPRFEEVPPRIFKKRSTRWKSEGGDFLILNKKTIAAGISARTDPRAIEALARELFAQDTTFETILAFNIPKTRAFMHLDTVFTQVDYDKFTIHPNIMKKLTVFEITRCPVGEPDCKDLKVIKDVASLESILEKHLNRKITLINIGGDDFITSGREQWNDGANTLTVAPGVVVVYSRNHVTNELLREHGLTVLEIPSSELSRGRGGPRCMSMPLYREDIEE
jgi:arginine deiminase